MPELLDIKRSIEQMPIDAITPIVRSSVGNDSAVVEPGWTVEPMSVDGLGDGTLGFLRVSGQIADYAENTGWHFVTKVLEPSASALEDTTIDFTSPALTSTIVVVRIIDFTPPAPSSR